MNLPLKIAAFVALVAIIVLVGRSLVKKDQQEDVEPRDRIVKRMDIEQSVYGAGVLRCSSRAEIASRVPGKIRAEDVLVDEGEAVQASQALCKITNEKLEKDLHEAEENHEIAQFRHDVSKEEYEFAKRTHQDHKEPSEKEVQRLKMELKSKAVDLKKAEEAVTALKEKVAFLTVSSPLAGTVLRSHLKRSELKLDPEKVYPEGTPLFIVGDLTSLAIYGTILESDWSKVEEGDAAMVQCGRREWLPAKVTVLPLIPSAASEGTRYDIQLDFENPPSGLNEGLTVNFRIIVEKKTNVLAVPVEYVQVEGGRHWVKRVVGKKATRVPIEVGISNYSFYEVTRGLKEKDTIRWDAGGRK